MVCLPPDEFPEMAVAQVESETSKGIQVHPIKGKNKIQAKDEFQTTKQSKQANANIYFNPFIYLSNFKELIQSV